MPSMSRSPGEKTEDVGRSDNDTAVTLCLLIKLLLLPQASKFSYRMLPEKELQLRKVPLRCVLQWIRVHSLVSACLMCCRGIKQLRYHITAMLREDRTLRGL